MKTALLIATLAMSVSFSAMAEQKVIKSCETTLNMGEVQGSITFKFDVRDEDGVITTLVTQTQNGESVSYVEEQNTITDELTVRAGLTADDMDDAEASTYNRAEVLVKHAIMVTADPILGEIFKAGLDLKAIRSAKVFVVGKEAEMGSTSLIAAKDASGKDIGTFFGGFLVGACK